MTEDQKKKILNTKWRALLKKGYIRPKDAKENQKRAKEAHHG